MIKSSPEEESMNSVVNDFEYIAKSIFRKTSTFFNWIGNVFIAIFLAWKRLLIFAVIGGILGVASLLIIPRKYESSMVIKTHIDAKDQLFNDINYLNTLVETENINKVSEIFGISPKEAAEITSIDIHPFSNFNERLAAINQAYQELDSNLRKDMDIAELLKNDESSFINKFRITIYSKDPFVFENIESSLFLFLERVPQLNKLRKNKIAILQMQKQQYKTEIRSLDSLKSILNSVLIEQAKTKSNGMTINLGQTNQSESISPLKIYQKVEMYNQNITEIDENLPLYDQCYFIVSHLSQTGHKTIYGGLLRAIIGALILGVIAILSIIAKPVKR